MSAAAKTLAIRNGAVVDGSRKPSGRDAAGRGLAAPQRSIG